MKRTCELGTGKRKGPCERGLFPERISSISRVCFNSLDSPGKFAQIPLVFAILKLSISRIGQVQAAAATHHQHCTDKRLSHAIWSSFNKDWDVVFVWRGTFASLTAQKDSALATRCGYPSFTYPPFKPPKSNLSRISS